MDSFSSFSRIISSNGMFFFGMDPGSWLSHYNDCSLFVVDQGKQVSFLAENEDESLEKFNINGKNYWSCDLQAVGFSAVGGLLSVITVIDL